MESVLQGEHLTNLIGRNFEIIDMHDTIQKDLFEKSLLLGCYLLKNILPFFQCLDGYQTWNRSLASAQGSIG